MLSPKTIKKIASVVVPRRASLEVLGHFRIQSGVLSMTDLDIFVEIPTDEPDAMVHAGQFAKKLDFRGASVETVTPTDFPLWPKLENVELFPAADTAIFNRAAELSEMVKAAATDEYRGVLRKIMFSKYGACCTDGHRLYGIPGAWSGPDMALPVRIAALLSAVESPVICAGIGSAPYTSYNDSGEPRPAAYHYFYAECANGVKIAVKLDDDNIPDVKKVIPEWKNQNVVDISAEHLPVFIAALKKIEPYCNEKTRMAVLQNNAIYVNNRDQGKMVKIELPFPVVQDAWNEEKHTGTWEDPETMEKPIYETIHHTGFYIGINVKYFLELISSVRPGNGIKIGTRTQISAITIQEENTDVFRLLMSLRVLSDDDAENGYNWSAFEDIGCPSVMVKKAPAAVPVYYLAAHGAGLFQITENPADPGVVRKLTAAESRALLKMGVVAE